MTNSNNKVIIVGAGSVGGHVASNRELYGLENSEILFVDDNPEKIGSNFMETPVVSNVNSLLNIKVPTQVVLGIAFPKIKHLIIQRLRVNKNLIFPTLIAKNSWVSNKVTLGDGVIIYPGCAINYGTYVGDFTVINMNCAVGHDCQIGLFVSLAPGVNLGGHTLVGSFTELGIGASTRQFISIGENVVVGGQSMIIRETLGGVNVAGVPAVEIPKKDY